MRISTISGFLVLVTVLTASSSAADKPSRPASVTSGPVKFVPHRVDTFRSEACGVGDFNNDRKLDIVAGPYLYPAPDWKSQQIRTLEGKVDDQGKGYYWDFANLPLDVDGDGLLDVVSCSWHGKRADWFRNTGLPIGGTWECPTEWAGGAWPRNLIEIDGNYECADLWDIDGDGKAAEILPVVTGTIWYERGKRPDGKPGIVKHVISEKRFDWGVGAGDVNGDGRTDVLRPGAWFEAPENPRSEKWKEHPLAVGNKQQGKPGHTPQILVYDVNADGLGDIVTSSAHGYGIFWYQQLVYATRGWKQHVIDDTWTQAHALTLADLDGDGDLDLVTGKRFMAHNGGDPDAFGPLGVYWYELKRGPKPVWTKHAISYDERIGAGLNIPVVDLDGDGDLDIMVTGKFGGPVWFENKAK